MVPHDQDAGAQSNARCVGRRKGKDVERVHGTLEVLGIGPIRSTDVPSLRCQRNEQALPSPQALVAEFFGALATRTIPSAVALGPAAGSPKPSFKMPSFLRPELILANPE